MFRRGHGEHGVGAQVFVRDEREMITVEQEFPRAFLKPGGPVECCGIVPAPGIGVQVVYEVAAPHDQDLLVAQGVESFSDFIVVFRRLRLVHAELHDGYVRLREKVAQHRPCPVVESPSFIKLNGDRRQQVPDPNRQLGAAGSGVIDLVQLPRKTAKIMDCPGRGRIRYHGARHIPVRGNGQNSPRSRYRFAEGAPGLGVGVLLQGVHGITVPEKDSGHAFDHLNFLKVSRLQATKHEIVKAALYCAGIYPIHIDASRNCRQQVYNL